MTNPKMKGNQLKDELVITESLVVKNLKMSINKIEALDPNGDIDLVPDGTGSVTTTRAQLSNAALLSGSSVEVPLGWNSAQDFSARNLTNVGNFTAATSGSASWSLGKGDIDGFVVKYDTTTGVIITIGSCEANGKFYNLNTNDSHSLTSLAGGFDFHYIYIDDSASSQPTPVFIDSTTEPEWSDPKRGWYNGDDRMVGVVSSRPGVAEVSVFEIVEMGKTIRYESGIGSMITMQANGSPDGTWQTPTSLDGSAVTPVSAVTIGMQIRSTDITSTVTNYMTSAEFAAIETATGWGQFVHRGYNEIWLDGWIALGPSRNVKIAGDDDDDNNQDVWVIGFEYLR